MTTRYKSDLYTPGQSTPGKEVIRFDQSVQADFDKLQARRRELSARLTEVKTEIAQVKVNRGVLIANGADDSKEFDDRLAELRTEQEKLQDALDYLSDRAELLKRSNAWLTC